MEKTEMVLVNGGTFQMGSNDGEKDVKPVHTVTVSSFYIGKYPVTQKEWWDIMGYNPSIFDGNNLPVDRVSWFDTLEFCNKLSIKEGLTPVYEVGRGFLGIGFRKVKSVDWTANGYRLPTETEWEYAAKGGNKSKGVTYAGSDYVDEVAWYFKNSGDSQVIVSWDAEIILNNVCRTHPVGQKKPNELGIYDMSGNVWEWCWDWYGEYTSSAKIDPRGPSSGSQRVIRGGCWSDTSYYLTSSYRFHGRPSRGYYYGFRYARNFD